MGPIGVGWVGHAGWGEWVIQGSDGSCRSEVGSGGSYRGGVGYNGSCRGGVGWVMQGI